MELERLTIERSEKWKEWAGKIPCIKFEPTWEVHIIPPYGGAMARFVVKYMTARVSVYLDCHDSLGCMEHPYWEIYPRGDDCQRFHMYDSHELVDGIKRSIKEQLESNQ